MACGVELIDLGHEVTIIEQNKDLGGLAGGVEKEEWEWPLEKFYHHIFANDTEIRIMAKKVGCLPVFSRPMTSSYIGGSAAQLDSPLSLLKFKHLSLLSRLHTGLGIAILKFGPKGRFWEKIGVMRWLPRLVGKESYEKIWERLLVAKFGKYLPVVNMGWFWARIVKRTPSLGYFNGGFQAFAEKMASYFLDKGGKIIVDAEVREINKEGSRFKINGEAFDRAVITTPLPVAQKILGEKVVKLPKLDYLWGQTLILELNNSLIKDYWLNILEKNWPFLVAVEHTRFVDKSHYGDRHIVYLGNYLEDGDKRLLLNEDELLDLFLPYLRRLNVNFSKKGWIIRTTKCQMPYAQPVFPRNYSKLIPDMETSIKGIYLANMSMVYPWDRGTNYAVKIGVDVARLIGNSA